MERDGNSYWIDFLKEHQISGLDLGEKDYDFFTRLFWADLDSFNFLWDFLINKISIEKFRINDIIKICVIPMILKDNFDMNEAIEYRRIINSKMLKEILKDYPNTLTEIINFEEEEFYAPIIEKLGVVWIEDFSKSNIGYIPSEISKIRRKEEILLKKENVKCYRSSFNNERKLHKKVLSKFPELVSEVCFCLNENGTKKHTNVFLSRDVKSGVLYNQFFEGRNYLKMISIDGKKLRWFFQLSFKVKTVNKILEVFDEKNRVVTGFLGLVVKEDNGDKLKIFNHRNRKTLKSLRDFDNKMTHFSYLNEINLDFFKIYEKKSTYSKLPISSLEVIQTSSFLNFRSYHLKDNLNHKRDIFLIFDQMSNIIYEARTGIFDDKSLLWHTFLEKNRVLFVFDSCLGVLNFKEEEEGGGECLNLRIIKVGLLENFKEDFKNLKIRRYYFDREKKILDFKAGSGMFKLACVKLLGYLDIKEVV